MLPIIAAGSCLAAFTSAVQSKDSSSQWTPTLLSPMKIAKRVDGTLHALNHTTVTYLLRFKLDTGMGTMGGLATIKDKNTFRVESPSVGATETAGVTYETRVAVGGKLARYHSIDPEKKGEVGPFTTQENLPNQLADSWLRNGVRSLFTAVGSSSNPLEKLVSQARASSEYRVSAEQRTILIGNQPVTEYRIYIERSSAAAKKLGDRYYEIVVNSKYFLPITMNAVQKKGKKVFVSSMYMTQWNLHAASYPDKAFDLKTVHVETRNVN